MSNSRGGRPSTYKINGSWPDPPEGGWRSSSTNTAHGKLLIGLLKSGVVSTTDDPSKIWVNFEGLRVVNPQTKAFVNFVKKCQAQVEEDYDKKMPSDPSHYTGSDDDDDFSVGPDPPRMPMPRNSSFQDPLLHRHDYSTRDQQISLPARVNEGNNSFVDCCIPVDCCILCRFILYPATCSLLFYIKSVIVVALCPLIADHHD